MLLTSAYCKREIDGDYLILNIKTNYGESLVHNIADYCSSVGNEVRWSNDNGGTKVEFSNFDIHLDFKRKRIKDLKKNAMLQGGK